MVTSGHGNSRAKGLLLVIGTSGPERDLMPPFSDGDRGP
jgi:hypothetical protein